MNQNPGVRSGLKEPSNIRALVIGDEPEDAEHAISVMRGAGYTVEASRVDETKQLRETIAENSFDIALHSLGAMDVKLADTIEALREHELFVPVLVIGDGDLTAGKALASGAADRIPAGDDEHLRHAMLREFQRVLARRRVHFLQEAYAESEQRARALMQSSRDAIAYIHDGMHVLANDAYLARFGYGSFEELEHMPIMDMVTGGDQKALKKLLRASATSNEAIGKLKLELQQADGSIFKAEVEFSRASIEGEACSQIIIRDHGNAEELEKQINRLSQRDNVTGLFNRQYFLQALTDTTARAERGETRAASFQVVLDDFSNVRSQVGVIGSDQIIADVAGVLQETCSENDLLARLDGATFSIISRTADHDELDRLAARIRELIKNHICEIEGHSINVTASIGIARIDGSTDDPNEILNRAERAWHQATEKGADNHVIYQPKAGEMSQKEIDRQWIEKIKEILKNDRLKLYYQPIVSLQEDESERYEVIVRMINDEGAITDIGDMMTAAERTGMSRGIDQWVLLNSLKTLVEQLKSRNNTAFFIPVSAQALEDPGLFRWMQERLKKLQLPQKSVVLQLDTSSTTTRIKQAAAFTKVAHKMGCAISLGRFGHGTDPFQVTRHIPVDFLRIHEEFTHDLAGNQKNQEAIKQIADQAREQNIPSICPGVNDAGALTVLWSLGTDMIQGDFLQEPAAEREYDFTSMSM